jgi:drug/metabolite transporter (DMT)-like permease
MFLVVLMYSILALTFVFAKKTLAYAHPFFLIGFRMILAGSILILYQRFFSKSKFSINKSDYWLFFKVALFHIYFSFIFEFWSMQYLSALKITMIYSVTPFVAAILSYILLKERLSWQKILGIIIGLGGLAPVLALQAGGSQGFKEMAYVSLPECVLFLAVISGAYAWFLVKQLMDKGYGLGMINGVAMLIGGILSLCTSGIFEGFNNPVSNWPMFLAWLSLLILAANIIVYNFYGWLLRSYSITFITFAGFLSPTFGTVYEWLFFGGHVTWHYFASLVLVVIGLYIFYREELSAKDFKASL